MATSAAWVPSPEIASPITTRRSSRDSRRTVRSTVSRRGTRIQSGAERDASAPGDRLERLQHAAADRSVLGDHQLDGVEQRAAVLGPSLAGCADAAVVGAQRGPAAARHDEPRAAVDELVEEQRVGAAD